MVLKDNTRVSDESDDAAMVRPGRQRQRNVLTVIAEYKAPDAMAKCHRIAHFLDWYARKQPGVPIAANLIYRAITGIPRTPRIDAAEVEAVRGGFSRAREILKAEYKRGLVSERGLGFRATTSDEDTANTQMRRDARRLVSAHTHLEETAKIVDASKIKNNELRTWVAKTVNPLLKALVADDRIHRLLPKPEADE